MEENSQDYNFTSFSDILKQVDSQADVNNMDRYYNNTITEY